MLINNHNVKCELRQEVILKNCPKSPRYHKTITYLSSDSMDTQRAQDDHLGVPGSDPYNCADDNPPAQQGANKDTDRPQDVVPSEPQFEGGPPGWGGPGGFRPVGPAPDHPYGAYAAPFYPPPRVPRAGRGYPNHSYHRDARRPRCDPVPPVWNGEDPYGPGGVVSSGCVDAHCGPSSGPTAPVEGCNSAGGGWGEGWVDPSRHTRHSSRHSPYHRNRPDYHQPAYDHPPARYHHNRRGAFHRGWRDERGDGNGGWQVPPWAFRYPLPEGWYGGPPVGNYRAGRRPKRAGRQRKYQHQRHHAEPRDDGVQDDAGQQPHHPEHDNGSVEDVEPTRTVADAYPDDGDQDMTDDDETDLSTWG